LAAAPAAEKKKFASYSDLAKKFGGWGVKVLKLLRRAAASPFISIPRSSVGIVAVQTMTIGPQMQWWQREALWRPGLGWSLSEAVTANGSSDHSVLLFGLVKWAM